MKGILRWSALLALAAAWPAHAQISDNVVKIGVLTDMAGVTADITGKGSVYAAEQAVREFGGTVLGRRIQVIFADHNHKADLGASIARKWYDAEQVDVIVDVPNSAVALAVQDIARSLKRIVMYSGAGTTLLSNERCSPYGFHWTYDTYGIARGTASAVTETGGKTWFFIAADYAFGHQLQADATAVVKANGGQVLGGVRHPLNTNDLSSFLLQAQASKVQVIGLANAGGDTINAIKQAGEFGLTKAGIRMAALIFFVSDVHGLGLEKAQGTYLTTASYWDTDDATRAWSKAFKAKIGTMPSMIHAGVYGSVLHYLKAVKEAGSDDADKVAAAMHKIPIQDIFSKNARLRPDNKVMRDMMLAKVKAPAQSKYEWDYFEIVKTIPGEQTVWPLSESKCPMLKK